MSKLEHICKEIHEYAVSANNTNKGKSEINLNKCTCVCISVILYYNQTIYSMCTHTNTTCIVTIMVTMQLKALYYLFPSTTSPFDTHSCLLLGIIVHIFSTYIQYTCTHVYLHNLHKIFATNSDLIHIHHFKRGHKYRRVHVLLQTIASLTRC